MPINLVDPSYESFILGVLPQLLERKLGVLAMKTLANGGFFGASKHFGEHGDNPQLIPERVSISEALHFAWSLPISVLITGPDNPDQMKEKVDLARSFVTMDQQQRQKLIEKVADQGGKRVEYYKA